MKKVNVKYFFRVLTAFTLLLSLTLLTGCAFIYMIDDALAPESYPGSTWSTQDGKITFTVQEEYIIRSEGKAQIMSGEFVETSPLQTNIFGEISAEGETIPVFICTGRPFYMRFYSDDMPEKCEDTKDFSYFKQEYTLLNGDAYSGIKHFELKVEFSKIDEIPAGTVLDFYRTDVE